MLSFSLNSFHIKAAQSCVLSTQLYAVDTQPMFFRQYALHIDWVRNCTRTVRNYSRSVRNYTQMFEPLRNFGSDMAYATIRGFGVKAL